MKKYFYKASRRNKRLFNLTIKGVRSFCHNALFKKLSVWALRVSVLAYFIFCILFLVLHYVLWPKVQEHKADIEQIVSKASGHVVKIKELRATWQGINPTLSLTDVVVHDVAGGAALSLPSVNASFSWRSLLKLGVELESLEINNPNLDIRRDASGRLYVGGMFVDVSKSDDHQAANWLLSQNKIIVRAGNIRWNDALRHAPELQLKNVNFYLHNGWYKHQFSFQALPTVGLTAPLDVRGNFMHPFFARDKSDALRWTGLIYAKVQANDLGVWRDYIDYPIDVTRGAGTLSAWLNFDQAKVTNFIADLSLSATSLRLSKDLPLLDLKYVSGRISASDAFTPGINLHTLSFGRRGHRFAITNFSLATVDGLYLPATTISETYIPSQNESLESTTLKVKYLDLAVVAALAQRLPLDESHRKLLSDFSLQGQLKDFSAKWEGSYPNIPTYKIKGAFNNLSINSSNKKEVLEKIPALKPIVLNGFDPISGELDANEKGGEFSVNAKNFVLNLPDYWEQPIAFDYLRVRAGWSFPEKDQLTLKVNTIDFVRGKMTGALSGMYQTSSANNTPYGLGNIDVTGSLSGANVQDVAGYMPLSMPKDFRHWLSASLKEGKIEDLTFKLKGDLHKFPFYTVSKKDKPSGVFQLAARIVGGKIDFAPDALSPDGKSHLWPEIEHIDGRITFDNSRLEIAANHAQTQGVNLSDLKVVIPDILSSTSVLDIKGTADGLLNDYVAYVNNSLVSQWLDGLTEQTKASGQAKLDLKMQLPIHNLDQAKVKGSLQFFNNEIALIDGLPPFSRVAGKLDFSEKNIALNKVTAKFLDGSLVMSGGTQTDGAIRIKVDGNVLASGIRRVYSDPSVRKIVSKIKGGARYSGVISVKKQQLEMRFDSNLQGLGLDLPQPLQKTENSLLPLRVQLIGLPSSVPSIMRDQIKVSLGSNINVGYVRQKNITKQEPWRVVRGGVGIYAPVPEPDSGVTVNLDFATLNIDQWHDLMTNELSPTATVPQNYSTAKRIVGSKEPTADQYLYVNSVVARVKSLHVMGKGLDSVVLGASHQGNTWQANIDSKQASGHITWTANASGRGRVVARLATLTIPQSDTQDVVNLLDGGSAGTTYIPSIDIDVENFTLFNKPLGHLAIVANNVRSLGVREWRIQKLVINNPDGNFSATGEWTNKANVNNTHLNYVLDVNDAGKLLDRLDFSGLLRKGKGKIEGDINWVGLPFSIDVPSLSGQVKMNLQSGQFLKADPGVAKLLGVLSLQSLPRRFALDFRDVFSEGFAFDGISADASVTRGLASTKNFKMYGVNATVLMDGTADIAKETQNLHVVIVPEINASGASVAYAIAINPVIGLGTFLAQLFFREPLARAFTFEYQVTGPWQEPTITKLNTQAPEKQNKSTSDQPQEK